MSHTHLNSRLKSIRYCVTLGMVGGLNTIRCIEQTFCILCKRKTCIKYRIIQGIFIDNKFVQCGGHVYNKELKIKDTTDTVKPSSFLTYSKISISGENSTLYDDTNSMSFHIITPTTYIKVN